jgi:hypothetical protein
MSNTVNVGTAYICPMHAAVRQSSPGKCTKRGMALVPENTRFALLRHITSNPVHLTVVALIMLAVISILMMIKL